MGGFKATTFYDYPRGEGSTPSRCPTRAPVDGQLREIESTDTAVERFYFGADSPEGTMETRKGHHEFDDLERRTRIDAKQVAES